MRQNPWAIAVLVLAFFAAPVAAQTPYGYAGLALGEADDDVLDETDGGFKLLGGIRGDYVGGEMAFVDLGDYLDNTFEQYGVSFEFVAHLPLGDRLSFLVKGGLFFWNVEQTQIINGIAFRFEDDGVDPTYGGGLEYNFPGPFSVRGEYQRFTDIAGGDVDLATLALIYRFGY